MEPAQLFRKAAQYSELFSEVSLTTKITLGFVFALILMIFGLVSERCFEHRAYSQRKILFGRAQRLARARLPPLTSPHGVVSQIPRNHNDNNDDIASVI